MVLIVNKARSCERISYVKLYVRKWNVAYRIGVVGSLFLTGEAKRFYFAVKLQRIKAIGESKYVMTSPSRLNSAAVAVAMI